MDYRQGSDFIKKIEIFVFLIVIIAGTLLLSAANNVQDNSEKALIKDAIYPIIGIFALAAYMHRKKKT